MTASSPDFIEDLLESLKSEASTGDFYAKAQKMYVTVFINFYFVNVKYERIQKIKKSL